MSSAQTHHIALQDRALQSSEIRNSNLKYTHTVYLWLLPTLINIVRITDLHLKFWIVFLRDKECDSHMKQYPIIGEFKKKSDKDCSNCGGQVPIVDLHLRT